MDRSIKEIISIFPNVANDPLFKITSPRDYEYNCIAWSLKRNDVWVWPALSDESEGFVWFDGINNSEQVDDFVKAYEKHGFQLCNDSLPEPGYTKIALYIDANGTVTHAARQLPNGLWTSKLGWWQDIQHSEPQTLEGDFYGRVFCYMKAPCKTD